MGWARWVNATAGVWLFLSAWIFPAATWERSNQGLSGMCIFLIAFVAMAYARSRLLNTLLGLWVACSPFVFAMPARAASVNQFAVGLVVFAASLWPAHRDITHDRLATSPSSTGHRDG